MILIKAIKPQVAMVYSLFNPRLHWAYCFYKMVTT